MEAEMDSVITNTRVNEKYTMKQEFVTTTKNQQKLVVYSGRCYTLKRTKCNDKYWMCTEVSRIVSVYNRSRSCCGTLSTNLEATEVIRSSDHAESCPVTPPPPRILPSPAACRVETVGLREYTRSVMEVYDELASNASTSLETAAHFPMWDQTRHTVYNRRA
ncbi:conserved hypothetical protein [Trichinella spiralis]|uniref:hypothetical protein n=1 Tax=Trichinella spiralis TaxID=6334 RepID=UPI0001EFBC48|nr:conserved hypothetical protein [Trichinella spiralis]